MQTNTGGNSRWCILGSHKSGLDSTDRFSALLYIKNEEDFTVMAGYRNYVIIPQQM